MLLETYGWTAILAEQFGRLAGPGLAPARVVRRDAASYALVGEAGPLTGAVSGRFRHVGGDLPVVGDWVAVRGGLIQAVLPRIGTFSRKAAGTTSAEQVVCSHVDTAFLVTGLDRDFNLRRLERYRVLAREVAPVIVLNKADLGADPEAAVAAARSVAVGVPVHVVSATVPLRLDALRPYLGFGRTVALLGSSGAGKSSLLNAFLGSPSAAVGAVRPRDGRGRHTTRVRQLLLLPGGGMMMDNPGLREIGMHGGEDAVESAFAEVQALAGGCRFKDCQHAREPGCAVHQALGSGQLDLSRFEHYLHLRKELRHALARAAKPVRRERGYRQALWAQDRRWAEREMREAVGAPSAPILPPSRC